MIENIERTGNLFYVKVSGQITKEDVKYVTPMLEKMIVECKQIKLLVYLNDVTGYTIGGFIADFILYFKYMNAFKNMAIVSNNSIFKKEAEKFSKFFCCNMKYFDVSELAEAKDWINQF
jgi:hypothetical protein